MSNHPTQDDSSESSFETMANKQASDKERKDDKAESVNAPRKSDTQKVGDHNELERPQKPAA